ncbi:MAG: hypothetical protein JXR15_08380 [Shimia sp.]|uniref:hypothetical protein n=1 Tax=Shimia sp. TaxID=1954381 RepID=UPI003B8B7730
MVDEPSQIVRPLETKGAGHTFRTGLIANLVEDFLFTKFASSTIDKSKMDDALLIQSKGWQIWDTFRNPSAPLQLGNLLNLTGIFGPFLTLDTV